MNIHAHVHTQNSICCESQLGNTYFKYLLYCTRSQSYTLHSSQGVYDSEIILKTNRTLQHLIYSKEIQITVVKSCKRGSCWAEPWGRKCNLNGKSVQRKCGNGRTGARQWAALRGVMENAYSRRPTRKRSLECQLYWAGILRSFRKVSLNWPFVT